MFKLSCLSACLLCCVLQTAQAQKKTVLIEPQKRKVNQDAPLPAQAYFNVQLPVNKSTAIIQVNIFKGKTNTGLLEKLYWVRPVNYSGDFAELPVDTKLKGNANYSFEVTIYTFLSDSEKVHLRGLMDQYVVDYIDAIVETNDAKLGIARKPDQIMNDLNNVVIKGLNAYRNLQDRPFEGFSDIVKLKIQQLANARLKNAAFNVDKHVIDSATSTDLLKTSYADQLKTQLKQIISTELNNYLDLDFVKVYDNFLVRNQYTERTQTVLPLFIGYGGVYFGGNVHNLDYDSKPYAGFSIPLGRGDGKYFSRTTFIMGVFLQNFKNGKDSVLTGPIVDRPVFAGLGFRIYDFINFNAGMVATSTSKQNLSNIKTENISLHPFIGLNFQFNLWLGVNKK